MPGRLLSFVVVGLLALAGTAHAQGKVEVQWLGQAASQLTTPGGKVIVIDPWVTTATRRQPAQFKTSESLGKVDLVLVTHGHFDHFADAPGALEENKVRSRHPPG